MMSRNHKLVKDSFKVQDKTMDLNVKCYQMFTDMFSDPTEQ